MTTRISCLVAVLLTALSLTPAHAQFGQDPVTVSAGSNAVQVRPGDQFVIAVVIEYATGFHSWPAEVQSGRVEKKWRDFIGEYDTWTAVKTVAPDGFQIGPIQWPELHTAKAPDPVTFEPADTLAFTGRSVVFVPIVVGDDVPVGATTISATVSYQACNDTSCLPPEDAAFEFPIEVIATDAAPAPVDSGDLFEGFDASVFAKMRSGQVSAGAGRADDRDFFGFTLPSTDGLLGVVVLALLAALGGFILNLTPCVLPVIPLKVMAISKHAGSPGKSVVLGMWMFAGVVAFWLGIGLPVAFLTSVTDPSRLFGIWWVTLGIGVVIAFMGVGIMGMFMIQLPQKIYSVDPKADSAWGSFLFGVMTAVLGLPCFGFVAGALLAGAATMPPALILTIFAALGVGMGLPYLVLSAKPGWIEKIPRTGPASELVKQIMGLMLLAAAAFFIGAGIMAFVGERPALVASLPWWGKVVQWWAISLFVFAAGAWLAIRTFQITKRAKPRAFFTVVAAVFAGLALLVGVGMTQNARDDFWILYTHQTWQDSVDSGKVVVVDFTADWCINCKVFEAMLNAEPIRSELLKTDVVPIKGDNTSNKAEGWEKMSEYGQTGIPLLMIWGPGLDEPWRSNAYTPDMVLEAIKSARAGGPATASGG